MSDHIYPEGTIGTLVYIERKCCDCNDKPVAWTADGERCLDCALAHQDQVLGKHWADHVLRRVETDPEFRERLRAALGLPNAD